MNTIINPKYQKYFLEFEKATSEVGNTIWMIDYDQFVDFFEELKNDKDVDTLTKGAIALMATGGLRVSEILKLKPSSFFYDNDGDLFGKSPVLKKKYLIKYKDVKAYRERELDYKNASQKKKDNYRNVLDNWMKLNRRKINSKIKEEFNTEYEEKRDKYIEKYGEVKDSEMILDTLHRTYRVLKKNPPKQNIPDRYFAIHSFLEEIVTDLWKKRIIGRKMPGNNNFLFSINRAKMLYNVKKALGEGVTNHSMRHSHISYLLFNKKKTCEEVSEIVQMSVHTVKNYQHYNITKELKKIYKK